MEIDLKYWCLNKSELAKKLSQAEIDGILSVVDEKYYKRGEDIFVWGKKLSSHLYIIQQGAIKVTSFLESGEEVIKFIFKKGEIFGILSLFGDEDNEDYVTAIDDVHLCILDLHYFRSLMAKNQNLQDYIFRLAGLRIRKLEKSYTSLLCKDAASRVQDFIFAYVKDFGHEMDGYFCSKNLLSNREIGILTSTSRQTVNKTLNGLKRNNLIEFDKEFIRISKNAYTVTTAART